MKRFVWCVLFVGCAGAEPHSIGSTIGPLATHDALVYLDVENRAALVVSPDGQSDAFIQRLVFEHTPVHAVTAPNPNNPEEKHALVLLPAGEQVAIFKGQQQELVVVDVNIPIRQLDVSADGRYGIGYEPEGSQPSRSLFAFPNSITVLNLGVEPPHTKVLRLGTSGARPLKAVFSESLNLLEPGLGAASRSVDLALVFARAGLVPVNLQTAEAGSLVPLSVNQDREIMPAEVLFTNNKGDDIRGVLDAVEHAFVRTTDGELFVLAISLSPEDMSLSVVLENVVTPDAHVYDMELFFDDEGNSLLLAAAGDELVLVNGYSGIARRVEVDTPVDTLVRFVDPVSKEPRGLAFSRREPASSILRVDPLGLQQRRATGLITISVGNLVRDIAIGQAANKAAITYTDARELGVLDLGPTPESLDVRFASAPQAANITADGSALLLVSVSPEDHRPYLARISLEGELATQSVRLDRAASRVGQIGDFFWVHHPTSYTDVTFFPMDALQRSSAVALRNVLLFDLLEQWPRHEEDNP